MNLRDQLFGRYQKIILPPQRQIVQDYNNNNNNNFVGPYYNSAPIKSEEIFGYRGYKCKECLGYEIVEFHFLGKEFKQNRISEDKHVCRAEALVQAQIINDKDGFMYYMHDTLLPLALKDMILNEWAKQNTLYLYSIELANLSKTEIIKLIHSINHDRSVILQYSLENVIELSGINANHWAGRAIKGKMQRTSLSEDDLSDFLITTDNSSFGLFNVRSNTISNTYLMMISPNNHPPELLIEHQTEHSRLQCLVNNRY
jgi:hypothetical protein